MSLRGLVQRSAEMRAEVDVRPGDGEQERGLEHRAEPFAAHVGVAEDTDEMRIERSKIEQRLIDVEDQDALAFHPAERAGFEPASLSATRFPSGRTRPLCDLSLRRFASRGPLSISSPLALRATRVRAALMDSFGAKPLVVHLFQSARRSAEFHDLVVHLFQCRPRLLDLILGWTGGEGGIRTREAFAYRFSRAAPSTTRTPLRSQV